MAKATDLVISGNVRYWETRRGLGYEAKTQFGSIWNDGNGGGTYFDHNCKVGKVYRNLSETELENVINRHEGVEEI